MCTCDCVTVDAAAYIFVAPNFLKNISITAILRAIFINIRAGAHPHPPRIKTETAGAGAFIICVIRLPLVCSLDKRNLFGKLNETHGVN